MNILFVIYSWVNKYLKWCNCTQDTNSQHLLPRWTAKAISIHIAKLTCQLADSACDGQACQTMLFPVLFSMLLKCTGQLPQISFFSHSLTLLTLVMCFSITACKSAIKNTGVELQQILIFMHLQSLKACRSKTVC